MVASNYLGAFAGMLDALRASEDVGCIEHLSVRQLR
jgi:hypothetical protein